MLAVSAGVSVGLASADLVSGFASGFTSGFSCGFSVTTAFSEADRSSSLRSDIPLAFTPASGRLLTLVSFSTGLPSAAVLESVLGSAVDTAAGPGGEGHRLVPVVLVGEYG